ncbi:MAG: NADH-quinone oxidoreductase subunit L [Nitrospinota bacterium]|jgi:NADH-quinone oxidoreductase subunit L|nr:NADH-quinone oxidoreductase subunit L [Nitrospinota bacterium]HJM41994.1 NADH-quinone oxidoreductase subunit L [Nitrospinota bacterium]
MVETLVPWIVALPGLGALINGLLGRWTGRRAHWVALAATGLSLGFALIVLNRTVLGGETIQVRLFEWVVAAGFRAEIAFLVDPLSSVMLFVVTGVGFLIHVYSAGYMRDDPGYSRFFTYLNLFMFAMLLLILGNNYLLMFVGWEGVGLCSYLLIGFWYHKKSASDAGKKAFIVNRIGDAGFLLGVFLIFQVFGTLDYADVFGQARAAGPGSAAASAATLITLCLFVGAVGKSAQLPLYTWLPDAMEGPTPVSALIHAATMVTAGVYMVARSSALYLLAPVSMEVVAVVGGLTAIFAATIALVQNDIKRVLAYSTVSQLGYMFLALGVGAFTAGIFHLMTHAFFKGLLFLGSGSVIHALHGDPDEARRQDMRCMGGLRKHLPVTSLTFYIGALAISGIPPLAGFFSKDEILAEAFTSGNYFVWVLGILAAFMTAFYMFRLIYMTFYGESRVVPEATHHLHESPALMTTPLVILAALAIVGGWVGIPGYNAFHAYLGPVFGAATGEAHASAALLWVLAVVSVAIGVGGWMLARFMYTKDPEVPRRLSEKFQGTYRLLLNKYWVDEIYDACIVRPIVWLMKALFTVDAKGVDGTVNGTSWLTVWLSKLSGIFDLRTVDGAVNGVGVILTNWARGLRRVQTGGVQNYALAMFLGVFVIVSLYLMYG